MANNTIHTQLDYEAVVQALIGLPQEVTGDSLVTRDMLKECGVVLLGLIRDSFIVKSIGGTDEAGDRWAPLTPATIANRGRKRKTGTTSYSKRRKGENSKIYDSSLRRAKNIIKSKGLDHDKYGGRDSAILHDSGALLDSLTPLSNSPDQILEVGEGVFAVGTKRKGAAAHHNGTGRLPQRRLWPSPNNFPDSWWKAITSHIQDGIVESVKDLIRGAM